MCRNRGSQALMEGRSANRREKRSTEEFPELTYVVTIKVEHLLVHVELLPVLQQNRLPIRDLDLLALIAQGVTTGVQSSDAKDRSESAQRSGFGRHVREDLGGLRGDRFLADPETDRGIGRDAEHHIRRVDRQSAAVPFDEAKRRLSTDLIAKDVGKKR
jgi:hypothetical protein